MFEYKIQENLVEDIRHSCEVINEKCEYTGIWCLSKEGIVSKQITEDGTKVPTTFQINDLMQNYVDN